MSKEMAKNQNVSGLDSNVFKIKNIFGLIKRQLRIAALLYNNSKSIIIKENLAGSQLCRCAFFSVISQK